MTKVAGREDGKSLKVSPIFSPAKVATPRNRHPDRRAKQAGSDQEHSTVAVVTSQCRMWK